MSKAVVPGIPLAALNCIKDENTKAILSALIDGWQMRNDQTGSGEHKFLTQADLNSAITQKIQQGQIAGGPASPTSGAGAQPPGYVAGLLSGLVAQIVESKLWKDLGSRIESIDIKGAKNTTGVLTESTNRVNSDNALLETVITQFATIKDNVAAVAKATGTRANSYAALANDSTTLQARIGLYNSASQQLYSEVEATVGGGLSAQFTVKQDLNGYVSGFGLASTSNHDVNTSAFYVRADRFSIGSPEMPRPGITKQGAWNAATPYWTSRGDSVYYGEAYYDCILNNTGIVPTNTTYWKLSPPAAANVPFIVRTDTWVERIKGVDYTRNGGVFMDGAWIKYASIDEAQIANAAITTAKIEDLSVKTLKIAGNAVTVPVGAPGYGYVPSVNVTLTEPGKVLVIVMANWLAPGSGEASGYLRASCGGQLGEQVGISMGSSYSGSATAFGFYDMPAGTFACTISQYTTGGARTLGSTSVFAIGLKR